MNQRQIGEGVNGVTSTFEGAGVDELDDLGQRRSIVACDEMQASDLRVDGWLGRYGDRDEDASWSYETYVRGRPHV